MPITLNQFKCSNGHSFEANAKLRTRCPSCGVMTKRSFPSVIPAEPPEKEKPISEPEPSQEPEHKPTKKPVLVRVGRPRMTVRKPAASKAPEPKAKPKGTTLIGSKVSAGLVKTHTVKRRGVMPTIKKRPVKTAVARGISGHEQKPRFHDQVIKKYGWF